MNRSLLVRTALSRLVRFKARTALVASTIALAVFATVLLVSLASRVEARFVAFLGDLYPADAVVIFAGAGPMSRGGPRNLKLADAEAIAASTGIDEWDPLVFAGPRPLRAGAISVEVPVVGSSERAERVRRRSVTEGRYLSPSAVAGRGRELLLGATAAARLFPDGSALGGTVHLDGAAFEVVGLLEPRGADPHGSDQDLIAVIPFTTLLDQIVRSTSISGVTFRVDDLARVPTVAAEATRLLRERHQIGTGQADDFSVFTAESMNAMFRRSFRTVRIFVPLTSAVLFVVAALVVLAVAQLALRARRREIGLRRAVGARAADVRLQVLAESLAVGLVGVASGLGLALVGLVIAAPIVERKFGVTALAPDWGAVALAVVAAVGVAAVGALLPARRAARLDPVEALR